MAEFTTNKNGQKFRLYGNYEKHSKGGTPMISISLQIVGKGTKSFIIIPFDCWKKAVALLKENEIILHEDYEKVLLENFKGL